MSDETTKEFLVRFGINPTEDLVDQVKIFVECLSLRQDRGARYGDTWKVRGYKGSLWMMDHKMLRLWEQWMKNTPDEDNDSREYLDDAYDLINYVCFFIQNVHAGRMWDNSGR